MAGVCSDVLCWLQNNFANHAKNNLSSVITSFYKEEEILAAKNCLFAFVDTLPEKPEGTPRNVKRQAGDNKRKLDCDDLLSLYALLDIAKVKLPMYTVANLRKVPPVNAGEVDVYTLAASVASLTNQFDQIMNRLSTIEDRINNIAGTSIEKTVEANVQNVADVVDTQLQSVVVRLNAIEQRVTDLVDINVTMMNRTSKLSLPTARADDVMTSENLPPPMSSKAESKSSELLMGANIAAPTVSLPSNPTWSAICQEDAGQWQEVAHRKSMARTRTVAPVRMTGTRVAATGPVKGIKRKDRLYAFVGRLHVDTSEDELANYLSDAGIEEVRCKKLKSKEGIVYKTAAFFVSCSATSRDLFYDEASWPDGVELRDWVFYNK